MAISNYAELQTAVVNWLHRADLTALIPDFILLGETRIFREVRCRVMEKALSSAISSGVVTVPTDYLEMKSVYLDGTPTRKLQRVEASQIYDQFPMRTVTGKPSMIAREGSSFIFAPYPDSSYTVKGIYYAKPTSIQSATNALFTAYPDLYLFAALCEALPYIAQDERAMFAERKLSAIIDQIRVEDAQEVGSGGGLMVSAA